MIKARYFLSMAAFLLAACSRGGDAATELLSADTAGEPISLSASVGDDVTRASWYDNRQDTRFVTGTSLMVEAFQAGAAAPYAKGSYVVQTTAGALAGSLTYPLLGGAVDLCAYHPATVTSASTSFAVGNSQSDAAGYRASDLMYATKLTNRSKGQTHALKFSHALTCIVVEVYPGDGITWDDISDYVGSVTVLNTVPTASLTISGGKITATASGTATHDIDITGSGDYHAGIIVPQTVAASTDFITLWYAGTPYTYTLPSRQEFKAGGRYYYSFTMNAAGLQLRSLRITDWTDGGTTDGTL